MHCFPKYYLTQLYLGIKKFLFSCSLTKDITNLVPLNMPQECLVCFLKCRSEKIFHWKNKETNKQKITSNTSLFPRKHPLQWSSMSLRELVLSTHFRIALKRGPITSIPRERVRLSINISHLSLIF